MDALTERWRALPLAWRRAVTTALALRVGAAVVALVGGGLLPGLDPVGVGPQEGFAGWSTAPPGTQGWGLLGAGLERFDALWYLAIAADGYPETAGVPAAAAFFPGYPLLIAALGLLLGGALVLAANVVSLVATAVALAGLHRLAEEVGGDDGDLPRRTVVVTAVFPAAFFLVAPYSESLFLATSTWGLVWLVRRRWLPAAAALVGAGVTRNVGVLLALPALLEVARARRETGRTPSAGLVAVAAAPAGLGLVLAHGRIRWGTWLAPLDVQSGWQRELRWPWETLVEAVRIGYASPGAYPGGYHALDVVIVAPVLVAVAWLLWRGRPSLAWFALANVLVWLVYPFPARPLMSTARFAVAVAPVFLAFATWTAGRARETVWIAASSVLLGVQLLLFVDWYYVF